jgi:hypothetical protein
MILCVLDNKWGRFYQKVAKAPLFPNFTGLFYDKIRQIQENGKVSWISGRMQLKKL